MPTTSQYNAESSIFCCAWCHSPVVLAEEIGGDLCYTCVRPDCGHSCHVNAPEGLAVKPGMLYQQAGGDVPNPCEEPVSAPEEVAPAAQRAQDKAEYHLSLGVRIARARGAYLVPSATTANVVYRVENGVCNCKAGLAGKPCWHTAAARAAA